MRLKGQARQIDGVRPVGGASDAVASGRTVRCSAGLSVMLAAVAAVGLAACSGQIIKHGHQFRETDVQQIQPGMSQDQVKLTLGTPATTATVNGGAAYYYISSTAKQVAFMLPTETDRQVLAVYFNPLGTVERVANYGQKDGKVFDHVSKKTPAPGVGDDGILKQLFRNLGKKQIFGD